MISLINTDFLTFIRMEDLTALAERITFLRKFRQQKNMKIVLPNLKDSSPTIVTVPSKIWNNLTCSLVD